MIIIIIIIKMRKDFRLNKANETWLAVSRSEFWKNDAGGRLLFGYYSLFIIVIHALKTYKIMNLSCNFNNTDIHKWHSTVFVWLQYKNITDNNI